VARFLAIGYGQRMSEVKAARQAKLMFGGYVKYKEIRREKDEVYSFFPNLDYYFGVCSSTRCPTKNNIHKYADAK